MTAIIPKPRKVVVPLARGLAWRGGGGFIYQEKLDGRFAVRERGNAVLCGELMTAGAFYAFDVMTYAGEDVRLWPYRERLRVVQSLDVPMPATGNGGEFLEAVLAAGGEGIVAKELDAPFGASMWAAKRLETFRCVVTGFCGGTQSVAIRLESGQPCGHVALRGGKIDQVQPGSVIKVEGMGLTAAGMIREPRICRDTPGSWLVSF